MYEVRKILVLILKQDDMMKKSGPIYLVIKKYENDTSLPLSDSDESLLLRSIQFLQRISRRIAQF